MRYRDSKPSKTGQRKTVTEPKQCECQLLLPKQSLSSTPSLLGRWPTFQQPKVQSRPSKGSLCSQSLQRKKALHLKILMNQLSYIANHRSFEKWKVKCLLRAVSTSTIPVAIVSLRRCQAYRTRTHSRSSPSINTRSHTCSSCSRITLSLTSTVSWKRVTVRSK